MFDCRTRTINAANGKSRSCHMPNTLAAVTQLDTCTSGAGTDPGDCMSSQALSHSNAMSIAHLCRMLLVSPSCSLTCLLLCYAGIKACCVAKPTQACSNPGLNITCNTGYQPSSTIPCVDDFNCTAPICCVPSPCTYAITVTHQLCDLTEQGFDCVRFPAEPRPRSRAATTLLQGCAGIRRTSTWTRALYRATTPASSLRARRPAMPRLPAAWASGSLRPISWRAPGLAAA